MTGGTLDSIEDILDAMDKAEIFVADVTFEEFAGDFRIHFAVVRALEIIGEAAKRLPSTLRDKYPAIPWKAMAGMRDRIIHGYDRVDLEMVWNVVRQDIPNIRPSLQQIVVDYES